MREELERFMSVRVCPTCKGARLKPEALAVRLHGKTITEVSGDVDRRGAPVLRRRCDLTAQEAAIAERLLRETRERLGFLHDVGLDYLTLERRAGDAVGRRGRSASAWRRRSAPA